MEALFFSFKHKITTILLPSFVHEIVLIHYFWEINNKKRIRFTKIEILKMNKILNRLIAGEKFDSTEAEAIIINIGNGEVNPSQIAAFLMGIQQRGITVDELMGFREGMLKLAKAIDLEDFEAMDVCGTGGDGKDTFNISTTSAFVVAGAGQAVAKHGNHGVSSAVGSSTVLEYLGVKFTNDADFLRKKMETAGICYLHAPLFHPAMKYVAPIRKELGIRTFFNILGPILNPAMVKKQFTGVSDMTTFDLYKNLFLKSGASFGVVHSLDIYDEISLTSPFLLAMGEDAKTFEAIDLGFEPVLQEQLHGGAGLEDSAKIMLDILQNKGTKAQTQAVLANAAVALSIGKGVNIDNGIALAKESLESGKAYSSFKKLVE